jgi:hypothetical protein
LLPLRGVHPLKAKPNFFTASDRDNERITVNDRNDATVNVGRKFLAEGGNSEKHQRD